MEDLVPLQDVEKLSERVIVIRGQNPGKMTLQGTNTYLIGTGRERILIDAAQGIPAYGSCLETVLKENNCIITDILLTHRHHDHIDGIPQVSSLLSSSPCLWKWTTARDEDSDYKYNQLPNHHEFKIDGATLKILHTPGHSDDHIVAYLVEENLLFSGDSVLGQGTAVFEGLGEYMRSLALTRDAFPDAKKILPAHGPVLEDGVAVIDKYISHRVAREKQIFDALASFMSGQWSPVTSMDIVKLVYKDYPQELWPFAEHGVLQHLDKLLEEKRVSVVEENGEKRWTVKASKL
ncbi:hypothetical protein HDU97_006956 [Phlyctochytrium planicorne]|nr:hypothetical protein HDU97_006956 [Phlyctochytrium planicorne]